MIKQIDCTYLSPNKTIEEISVTSNEDNRIIYVYNYKGLSFRVFPSKNELKKFFQHGDDAEIHFSTEDELDNYLEQITF